MILLIDNYDSFSYNLYQLIGSMEPDLAVVRNDALTVDEILQKKPSAVVLSPGPGKPADAGICVEAVRRLSGTVPILGVCLGHQAICEAFGAEITYAKRLMHGKKSVITFDGDSAIFKGISGDIAVARYHSLAASDNNFPSALRVTARTDDGEIMAVEHKTYPVFGLQFHPESILTQHGKRLVKNFLEIGRK